MNNQKIKEGKADVFMGLMLIIPIAIMATILFLKIISNDFWIGAIVCGVVCGILSALIAGYIIQGIMKIIEGSRET